MSTYVPKEYRVVEEVHGGYSFELKGQGEPWREPYFSYIYMTKWGAKLAAKRSAKVEKHMHEVRERVLMEPIYLGKLP